MTPTTAPPSRGWLALRLWRQPPRGAGLLLGIERVSDTAQRTPMTRSSDVPARVAKAAYKAGLMVRISGPNLILSPPLIITREEVDLMCDVLETAFAAVQEGRA
jgi:adenosylmethionine-8-amino-7-oxononanoate aminotransferase